MPMKLVKQTAQYSIYQRGDNRFAVKDARKKAINGDAKARILVEEELVKVAIPAKVAAEDTATGGEPAGVSGAAADAPAEAIDK
jgi:hypothetical protein